MRGFLSVYKREIKGYFATPLAYVFLVIFLVASALMTFRAGFFEMRQASLRTFFQHLPALFLFLVSAIAMRLWAEERRTNTIELLFSLPISTTQAVLGKFLAAGTVILLALALTCPMVLTVFYLGNPDPGPIVAGYLGSLLLAATLLAAGSFFSSLTRNQVIAFVLTVVAGVAMLYAGSPTVLNFFSGVLTTGMIETAERLSLVSRFEAFQQGVIELRDLALFVLLGAGWLWATVIALRERRATG